MKAKLVASDSLSTEAETVIFSKEAVKPSSDRSRLLVPLTTMAGMLTTLATLLSTKFIWNFTPASPEDAPELLYFDRGSFMFAAMFIYTTVPLLFTAYTIWNSPKTAVLWSNIETVSLQSGILLMYFLTYFLTANGYVQPWEDKITPGRRIHFARYMGWHVAQAGYAYLIMCKFNRQSLRDALPYILVTPLQDTFGLWADAASSLPMREFLHALTWSSYLLGAFGLWHTMPPPKPAEVATEKVKRGFVHFSIVHWFIYGPVYHLGQYGAISSATEQLLYCMLDISYKMIASTTLVVVNSAEWTQMRLAAEHEESMTREEEEFQQRLQMMRDALQQQQQQQQEVCK
uniref:Uncharacterized protein n=1 Tax=Chromera velia CCMP2878 TaxID=1169474 RepID=A0A0G4HDQ8_9ALVE|eukprot:Cvel_6392.t1-p1 / transcript=Cvel_6392.t1 / gene=Cvel_6392 / organism=Chromera_velia_CCMP2878 / gene_product=hypothetical protein / transcript_product=hypothetical protein / location=Cvel_scaffold312:16161-17412(+) / protein_length=344 / sequence_SO=supercontig / SO=protein_coding / is_pseudo=false